MDSDLWTKNTIHLSKRLLGSTLYRKVGETIYSGIITETEAYLGPEDQACHSARGKTKRTQPMFGPAGTIYVYFIYGMYYCLNIVTCGEGRPEAVLIRGLHLKEPLEKILNGPGKLCKELQITSELSGKMLGKESGIWIEFNNPIPDDQIVSSPRIGISAPEPWKSMPLRFIIKTVQRPKSKDQS